MKLNAVERNALLAGAESGGTLYDPPAELRRRKQMLKFVSRVVVEGSRSAWRCDVYELLPRGWKTAAQLRGIESRRQFAIARPIVKIVSVVVPVFERGKWIGHRVSRVAVTGFDWNQKRSYNGEDMIG